MEEFRVQVASHHVSNLLCDAWRGTWICREGAQMLKLGESGGGGAGGGKKRVQEFSVLVS